MIGRTPFCYIPKERHLLRRKGKNVKSLASKNTVSASRREFLGGALCAGAFFAAGTGSAIGADAPSNRVRLAIAGLREKGRGVWLLKAAAVLPGVEVAVVCDVDSRAMDFAAEEIFRRTGKRPRKEKDLLHLGNFVDAIRAKDPSMCVAPVYEGVASTVMAHAANMAYFTGETVRLDGKTGELLTKTPEAAALWNREYEKGWEPPKA